jgi:hypothetical protein
LIYGLLVMIVKPFKSCVAIPFISPDIGEISCGRFAPLGPVDTLLHHCVDRLRGVLLQSN